MCVSLESSCHDFPLVPLFSNWVLDVRLTERRNLSGGRFVFVAKFETFNVDSMSNVKIGGVRNSEVWAIWMWFQFVWLIVVGGRIEFGIAPSNFKAQLRGFLPRNLAVQLHALLILPRLRLLIGQITQAMEF